MNSVAVSNDTIIQEVTIKGSAERIFAAITSPGELYQWWNVSGKFQVQEVECDVRLGGKWIMRVEGNCEGGNTENVVSGEYRLIERPHVLVYTWLREDKIETEVRWDLEEKNGFTKVRVTHSGLNTEALRARNNGWSMVVGLLQAYVESLDGKGA